MLSAECSVSQWGMKYRTIWFFIDQPESIWIFGAHILALIEKIFLVLNYLIMLHWSVNNNMSSRQTEHIFPLWNVDFLFIGGACSALECKKRFSVNSGLLISAIRIWKSTASTGHLVGMPNICSIFIVLASSLFLSNTSHNSFLPLITVASFFEML